MYDTCMRVTHHLLACGFCVIAFGLSAAHADDDQLEELLKSAPAASAPAPVPESGPATSQPLKLPPYAREGTIELNNGQKLTGPIWSTYKTPLRLWIEDAKTYRDIDLAIIKTIEVNVRSATLEPDWRWLKEGADQKVYSGKNYPMVDLAYHVTLINGQSVDGTVVAPIYIYDGKKPRSLALYKKYKGTLEETLSDIAYIKQITFSETGVAATLSDNTTTRLPLIED